MSTEQAARALRVLRLLALVGIGCLLDAVAVVLAAGPEVPPLRPLGAAAVGTALAMYGLHRL